MSCSVNPSCGREGKYRQFRSNKLKKILVIGGGVAGMEAARIAAERGHKALLFEKTDQLGGHLREACVPEFKKDLKRLLAWYERQMRLRNVEAHLGTEMTNSMIDELDYDVAVLATGSVPYLPSIPGIQVPCVTNCCDVLSGKRQVGNEVIILGGGLEGCETAIWLSQKRKNVLIIEMLDRIATGIHDANRQMILDMLEDLKVRVFKETKVIEIQNGAVEIEDKRINRRLITCDSIVSAVGLKSVNGLFGTLKNQNQPFYPIGDCKVPRNIHYAISEGFNVGHYI